MTQIEKIHLIQKNVEIYYDSDKNILVHHNLATGSKNEIIDFVFKKKPTAEEVEKIISKYGVGRVHTEINSYSSRHEKARQFISFTNSNRNYFVQIDTGLGLAFTKYLSISILENGIWEVNHTFRPKPKERTSKHYLDTKELLCLLEELRNF